MSGKLEPRYGAEVFVNKKGDVVIKQDEQEGLEVDRIVLFRPAEIPELIEQLKETHKEALDFEPEEDGK